jgi:cob(I)alamin adenosyltransferase
LHLARPYRTMKIYTKLGDEGWTRLADGSKTRKNDPRVELYGTADELNSHIGVAMAILPVGSPVTPQLLWLQNILFELGSELAGYFKERDSSVIRPEDTARLESWIDGHTAELPPMRSFVLPGGSHSASALHVCRTVCRRLERQMTALLEQPEHRIYPEAFRFVNRMSDYLFTSARYANLKQGIGDIPWQSREKAADPGQ